MTEKTISMEQSAEIRKKEAEEEGYRIGYEEVTHRFIRNLLKEPDFTFEKIAHLAAVSLETVKKIYIISIVENLAEIKRKEILEECRVRYYAEDYSMRYTRGYIESYKIGLLDGIELATRGLSGNFLRDT